MLCDWFNGYIELRIFQKNCAHAFLIYYTNPIYYLSLLIDKYISISIFWVYIYLCAICTLYYYNIIKIWANHSIYIIYNTYIIPNHNKSKYKKKDLVQFKFILYSHHHHQMARNGSKHLILIKKRKWSTFWKRRILGIHISDWFFRNEKKIKENEKKHIRSGVWNS